MRNRVKLALGLAGVASLALALGSAPASASSAYTGLTFWSGYFAGQSVSYANPSTSCTTLPFVAHSEWNQTDKTILVYETTDCTGPALTFPANDIHNFSSDGRSFRAAS
ncbi:hypothetical protein GCM10010116_61420 [Microbispora rosea subsp. aerata]|nr:hypothetical protein [Microbispora rosea]GGO30685.1 hypothetical protein GCM10010116_61420 [Microbispora rosea subsp. aerata]GIH59035.1 hypothetical protein Mro02_59490 [Microbispora rosea subsp. aerata]GLJ85417.1 hypothetical protein GCM10017588_41490 [Microbispora rosea subsp. aerata]